MDIAPEIDAFLRDPDDATMSLRSAPARLIAIGGLSGSGKSTLAMALAPELGCAPGAVALRSDVERKALAGVTETDRLPPGCYTREASERVYSRLMEKAAAVLEQGHSAVLDAVFANSAEQREVEAAAARAGAGFSGLWLTAPEHVLRARVAARSGDASDADESVVRLQLERHGAQAPEGWIEIEAGESAARTLALARAALDPL